MVEGSVIIVTWGAQKFITQCLDSVFAQSLNNLEVFVVDNGSEDETVKLVEEYGDKLKLIKNENNLGFSYANNQAMAKACGNYVLFLNSDVKLEKDYLSILINFLKNNKEVGMVQGKYLRWDKKTIDCLGLFLTPLFRFKNLGEGKLDTKKHRDNFKIFGPGGAAALYKREVLEQIKWRNQYFDNDFFFLVEDFDMAWRAQNKGFKSYCITTAVCYHYRDSSAHKSYFRQYLSFRNRYWLLLKNAPAYTIFWFMIVFIIYDIPRFTYMLATNKYTKKSFSGIDTIISSNYAKETGQ